MEIPVLKEEVTDIVWDFDGTLCNSYSTHILQCFRNLLWEYGIHDSDEHIMNHLCISIGEAVRYYQRLYGAPDDFLRRFQQCDEQPDYDHMVLYDGVEETLRMIVSQGRKNHLLTNRRGSAIDYLSHVGLIHYFTELLTGDMNFALKPSPAGLQLLMRRRNITAASILMVGDRFVDIQTGRNAGCLSCFFNSNQLQVPEYSDFVVNNYNEMQQLLKNCC